MSDESDPLENGTRGKLLLWDSFYLIHLVFMTGWRQFGRPQKNLTLSWSYP
jgi:hypothetical protein